MEQEDRRPVKEAVLAEVSGVWAALRQKHKHLYVTLVSRLTCIITFFPCLLRQQAIRSASYYTHANIEPIVRRLLIIFLVISR